MSSADKLRRHALRIVAAGMLVVTTGCAAPPPPPPPPPPPTVVNITLNASADVNKSTSGQGSPVVVRVYQLTSDAGFKSAEFFKLYNADAATLGPDIAKREEFLLTPGQSKMETLMPADGVKSIGFFGGYREFQKVMWRNTVDVKPHQTTNVAVTVDSTGINVKVDVVAPPPPPKPPAS